MEEVVWSGCRVAVSSSITSMVASVRSACRDGGTRGTLVSDALATTLVHDESCVCCCDAVTAVPIVVSSDCSSLKVQLARTIFNCARSTRPRTSETSEAAVDVLRMASLLTPHALSAAQQAVRMSGVSCPMQNAVSTEVVFTRCASLRFSQMFCRATATDALRVYCAWTHERLGASMMLPARTCSFRRSSLATSSCT